MGIDFSIILHALDSVFTFFIIGALGYFLAKKGWFPPGFNETISRLLMDAVLPVFLLHNINSFISRDDLGRMAQGILPPFVSILVTLTVSRLLIRVLGVAPNRRGIFATSCSYSNTMYIGVPVNMALFGPAALPYVLLYYFANCSLFWSLGNYQLASDASDVRIRFFSLGTLKKIFTLPMFGFLAGLTLLLLDVKLPSFLARAAGQLGGLTTPLVLISIGATLHDMGLSKIRFDRDLALVCLCRFVVTPLVMFALIRAFSLSGLMGRVFIIQASLPVMSSIPMLASYYRTDVEFATVAASATTLFSLATIPFYMVVTASLL